MLDPGEVGLVHERWRTLALLLLAGHVVLFILSELHSPLQRPHAHLVSAGGGLGHSQRLAPQALGSALEPFTRTPWPAEFRTWVSESPFALSEIFAQRASSHGTDKCTSHRYQFLYAKYLLPLRHRPIKLLEIGLGCGMPWGAGHSVSLWRELLPQATYYSIEFDRVCAEGFREQLGDRLFIGDQGDAAFLQRVLQEAGPMDVIIDDGSHQMAHQRTSLAELFFGLRVGGLYIMEDMQTAAMDGFGGSSGNPLAPWTSVHSAVELIAAMLGKPGTEDPVASRLYSHVASTDCFFHACVFQRGPPATEWAGPPPWRRGLQQQQQQQQQHTGNASLLLKH